MVSAQEKAVRMHTDNTCGFVDERKQKMVSAWDAKGRGQGRVMF